jgi:hypothetical protein
MGKLQSLKSFFHSPAAVQVDSGKTTKEGVTGWSWGRCNALVTGLVPDFREAVLTVPVSRVKNYAKHA